MKVLHIDSSILSDNSVSRDLTRKIVAQWKANHSHTTVDYLDLAVEAPSHLSAESLGFRLPAGASALFSLPWHRTTRPAPAAALRMVGRLAGEEASTPGSSSIFGWVAR